MNKPQPSQSKLRAYEIKGHDLPIKNKDTILYLGCSHGTSVLYLHKMFPLNNIFALDFSWQVMQEFLLKTDDNDAIFPLFADARHPDSYKSKVPKVDLVIQDIAQQDQVEIFKRNWELFAKKHCIGILVVKIPSIDVITSYKDVVISVKKKLLKSFSIKDHVDLGPYQRQHVCIILMNKGKDF